MPSYVATVSSSLIRVFRPGHRAKFDLPNGGVGFVTSFASTYLVMLIARRGADAAAVRDGRTLNAKKRKIGLAGCGRAPAEGGRRQPSTKGLRGGLNRQPDG